MKFHLLRSGARWVSTTTALAAVFILSASAAFAGAPLFEENFCYTAGSALNGQGGWSAHSGAGTNPITINAPGLSLFGYCPSSCNRAGTTATSGEDVNHAFTGQTSGSVYAAFLVNVVSSQATGDYFFHFFDGPITGNVFRGRVFLKKDASTTNYAFGIQYGSTVNTAYSPFSYAPGTTHLVVLKYTFVPGLANDQVSIFVDPAAGCGEPAATLTTSDATQTDAVLLDGLAIRQGSAAQAPTVQVDGIRVGTSWSNAMSCATVNTSVVPPAGGSIFPAGPVQIACGGSQTFTFSADSCYTLTNVQVDGVSQGPDSSYTISNTDGLDHLIVATFAPSGPFTITTTPGAGGTINPSNPTVACGSDKKLEIVPDSCYSIASVTLDGYSLMFPPSGSFSITLENIRSNRTLEATFAPSTFTITTVAGAGGTISPSNPTVACGGDVKIDILPAACDSISTVTVDGVPVAPTTTYTFTNVHGDHTIEATFGTTAAYTITTLPGIGGTMSPMNPTVGCGGDVKIQVLADSCYTLDSLFVDGAPVALTDSYVFTNPQANHTIQATFKQAGPFTITTSPGSGGTMSPSNPTAACGSDVLIRINPDSCYTVESVTVDGNPVAVTNAYTFSFVQANHTIAATFAPYAGSFTIATLPGTGGTMSPSNPTVGCGAEVKINIVPDPCYMITSVTVDSVLLAPTDTYTFYGVQANHSISATFAPAGPFAINAFTTAGGSVSPDTANVPCGADLKITITPDHGYVIASMSVDGNPVPVTDSYVFTNIQANHTLYVVFDVSTAVAITRLEAESVAEGIALKWQLASRGIFASIRVERSDAETGPWAAIDAGMVNDGDLTVAVDKSAAAGGSYYYRLVGTTTAGTQAVFGPVKGTSGSPAEFALSNAWPNPSTGAFTMSFAVAKATNVRLSVLDLQGREVAVLAQGAYSPGRYQVNWDGHADRSSVRSGMYFLRYAAGGTTLTRRLIVAQ